MIVENQWLKVGYINLNSTKHCTTLEYLYASYIVHRSSKKTMQPFLKNRTFTAFDVETTGLDPRKGDRIVEIAGVRIENGEIKQESAFSSFVNPQCRVSASAGIVNRIPEKELMNAPPIEEALPKFISFVAGSILVAHNAPFDISFLEAEKEGCWGYIEIPECLCTLHLSRAVSSHEYRHNLDVVARRLNLSSAKKRHRALPDTMLTAQAFLKLIDLGNIASMDELRQKASVRVAV